MRAWKITPYGVTTNNPEVGANTTVHNTQIMGTGHPLCASSFVSEPVNCHASGPASTGKVRADGESVKEWDHAAKSRSNPYPGCCSVWRWFYAPGDGVRRRDGHAGRSLSNRHGGTTPIHQVGLRPVGQTLRVGLRSPRRSGASRRVSGSSPHWSHQQQGRFARPQASVSPAFTPEASKRKTPPCRPALGPALQWCPPFQDGWRSTALGALSGPGWLARVESWTGASWMWMAVEVGTTVSAHPCLTVR